MRLERKMGLTSCEYIRTGRGARSSRRVSEEVPLNAIRCFDEGAQAKGHTRLAHNTYVLRHFFK